MTKVTRQLVNPNSIVVVGASNDTQKPGGAILQNIKNGGYRGNIYVVNPKEIEIQGITCTNNVKDLPQVDLAVLAIAAKFCEETVRVLTQEKETKAFIIISAGFGEESREGKLLEQRIVKLIEETGGCLIGPNCTGVLTPGHQSVFTKPLPSPDARGVDLISGSGATACFIMDIGIQMGLRFNHMWAVGNSAQLGIEDMLEYHDEIFDSDTSSKTILLYIENLKNPQKLLKHALSLHNKGCRIAAVKSGTSEAGSRAASSHTGALASSDVAVDALFRKAGIVRCYGREELVTVASIFALPELTGKNIAIVTHAGGPAVMLTDTLSKYGLEIPALNGAKSEELLKKLFSGSSVSNPIDFLATGTAENLSDIIDACNNDFDEIDAICVIFGTPGLSPIYDTYEVLNEKMKTSAKPIYPILPSTLVAQEEVSAFVGKGNVFFRDEVTFGSLLGRIYNTDKPYGSDPNLINIDVAKVREIIDNCDNGYLDVKEMNQLLDTAGIYHSKNISSANLDEILEFVRNEGYPVVMKVVGPIHKSDVGGVVLNIKNEETIKSEFERLIKIKGTQSVQVSKMYFGTEIFVGASRTDLFGQLILFGLGGVFIEILKDVQASLAPIGPREAKSLIRKLKGYKIFQGIRGQKPINEDLYADQIARVSALVQEAPEIAEMDLNPLIGNENGIIAVDSRIRIEKN